MLRIYLSGRMTLEGEERVVAPRDFPGRQGRIACALLVAERPGPVARSVLADALWPRRPPAAWDAALSSVISKLRRLFAAVGQEDAIFASGGGYEVFLPTGTWVDHEAAADAIHEAEAALQANDPARAYGPSAVAHHIARRPFLPGEEGEWIERRRDRLGGILVRALECRAEVYLWNREYALAVATAAEIVAVQPFRETAYQLLMRAHAAAGNSAEALRVYARCRTLIAEELGVSPSPATQAVHAAVLHAL